MHGRMAITCVNIDLCSQDVLIKLAVEEFKIVNNNQAIKCVREMKVFCCCYSDPSVQWWRKMQWSERG